MSLNIWFVDDLARVLDAADMLTADLPLPERRGADKVLAALRVALGVQAEERRRVIAGQVVRVARDTAARLLPVVAFLLLAGATLTACGPETEPADVAQVRAAATVAAVQRSDELAAAEHARQVQQAAAWSWFAFASQVVLGAVALTLAAVTMANVAAYVAARLQQATARHGLIAQVVETRAGTLTTAAALLPVGGAGLPDFDLATDAGRAVADGAGGGAFLASVGGRAPVLMEKLPADNDQDRRAALRLLRLTVQRRGAQSDRLATWRETGLSAATWTRTVALLRPYTVTRQGRNGGVFLTGRYPNAGALYAAIGERRAGLASPAGGAGRSA